MPNFKRYPVTDESDKFVMWASADEAHDLVTGKRAETLWHKKRIYGLRLISEDPLPERPVALRRRGFGDSHRHETERNPPNVWTFDYLKEWGRIELFRVIEQCRPPGELITPARARQEA